MYLWDFETRLFDFKNAENQISSINCAPTISALKTMGIDFRSPHAHSKTQTEDYHLTCSQYCLHITFILKRKKQNKTFFKTCHRHFNSATSMTLRNLVCPSTAERTASCLIWGGDGQVAECSPSFPVFMQSISWRHEGDEFTQTSSLPSPRDPPLQEQLWTAWLGPPTHYGIFRS
jgi:hypothetical protein